MQNAIFCIDEFQNEIETVPPEQLRPVQKYDFEKHKRKTQFYSQKRKEDEKNILTAAVIVLAILFVTVIGFVVGEPGLGLFFLAFLALLMFGGELQCRLPFHLTDWISKLVE